MTLSHTPFNREPRARAGAASRRTACALARGSRLNWLLLVFIPLMGVACQRADNAVDRVETPATVTTKGGVEMVLIPGGTFEMGSKRGKEDAGAVHTVSVDGFLMDKYEVTQAEYEKQGLSNPSHFKGPGLPVEQITWAQAAYYCNQRSLAEDLKACYDEATSACDCAADGYRLPTEAEWEYACRAGTTSDYSFTGGTSKLGDYAWFADNAGKKTHPVGQKKPNRWGLHDMHGNVAEWCNDAYDPNYYQGSPPANPPGPAAGKQYVLRGGSWNSAADVLRSFHRLAENPGFSDACLARDAIGFRCVRKAPSQKSP